ncbi:glycosyltransferase [Halomonas sp. CKK8]|uniref:glycosyltransferase n=1 Tax=Halomonas sp. CKK8 TaxID=3036127 RepID=UPI0024155F3E|nr:glycosyltransferase [Halomonas sp. CKK8]WFM69995.1 glycosyltransferase [Halomonas sp. CKK8]
MSKLISVLLPDLRGGGVERIRIVLAHEFSRVGHDVEFVLMKARGELLHEAKASFPVIDLATHRARGMPLALARYLRHRRPDTLLAAMWPLSVIAPVATRLSGHRCEVVVSEHNTLSVQYRDWGRLHRGLMRASMALGYRLADHRLGVSTGVVEDIARMSGLGSDAFDMVHNPVPPRSAPAPEAIEAAEALWDGPSGARVVTVGSMKAQKNHSLLLRAFARLDRPDARLMFVGDGKGRDELASLARELGVADRVILAGFHPDPKPFYQTADLFALSSNYEGFGNVIVEAMACGTPVVSTDCPSGPGEILDGGKFGRLVPVGDVEAMGSAIAATLDEPAPSEQLKVRAADFHPAKAAKAYLDLLGV